MSAESYSMMALAEVLLVQDVCETCMCFRVVHTISLFHGSLSFFLFCSCFLFFRLCCIVCCLVCGRLVLLSWSVMLFMAFFVSVIIVHDEVC